MTSGLTQEQFRASRPDASVWVAASAGTGKTHVLTARVLRLLLSGVPPEQLLCLTFTKAAAAEMANRLRRTLGRWTTLDDDALAADIRRTCGTVADDKEKDRARQLFARVLDLSDGLRIQTIHAFCQALLGRFPIEAGLSPQFQVIEDTRSAELLRNARDQVIARSRTPSGKRIADAFAIIAQELNEQDFERLMGDLVLERRLLHRLLSIAHGYGSVDGVLAILRRTFGIADITDEQAFLRDVMSDEAMPIADLRRLLDLFETRGKVKEGNLLPHLSKVLSVSVDARLAYWDAYRLIFLTKENQPRSTNGFPNKAIKQAWPGVEAFIAEEAERVLCALNKQKLLKVVGFTRAALTVGEAVLHAYDREKQREAVLDYDDLIFHTEQLLKRDDIAPWILYKLDAGITHVLVDEAQDTNPEQWAVIDALTSEFFNGEGARDMARTIFAVGDVKQSIYGFQRADPREFIRARDRVSKRAEAAAKPFDTVPLDLSFRSTRAVLSLVDAVFDDPDTANGLSIDHGGIRHLAHRVGDAGLVELWPIEAKAKAKALEAWEAPLVQEAPDSAQARLAVRIASRIAKMLTTSEELTSKGRPIKPGDILVLVRRRTEFVDHLVKALKGMSVPVAGSDRMKLTEQLAVQDLLAIIQFALLPNDDLNLATVLRGPLVNLLDEKVLFSLAYDRGGQSLWQRLCGDHNFQPIREKLSAIAANADRMPPFEFLTDILVERDGWRDLIRRLGSEVIDPIEELLRLAQDYERDHPASLQGFLKWIEQGGAEIKRDPEQGRDEVRILTVHGAKGLQAPIVFLPDCYQIPQAADPILKIMPEGPGKKPDLPLMLWRGNSAALDVGPLSTAREVLKARRDEEYRRLLYVALTRAEDRLYMAGWETESRGSTTGESWYRLLEKGFARLEGVRKISLGKDRSGLRFESEQKSPVSNPHKPQESHAVIEAVPDWLFREPPEEPTPARPLTPSRPDEDEPAVRSPLARGERNRYMRGLLMHRLLELLPDIAETGREGAAKRFLKHSGAGLDDATIDAWWGEISAILNHPEFAPLFAEHSTAEAPIAGLVGDRALSAQVDRLAVTETEVLIVDYKTNRPPPIKPDDVSPLYLRQMATYRAALRAIYPHHHIRCALLWTDGPFLMELDDKQLGPYAPD